MAKWRRTANAMAYRDHMAYSILIQQLKYEKEKLNIAL